MKPRQILNRSTVITKSFAVATAAMLLGHIAQAADGTWTNTAGGTWDTPTNWSGNIVAGGIDSTADFTTLNITAVTTVSLDAPTTLGGLVFGDTTPTTDPASGANYVGGNTVVPTGGWTLSNGGNSANILTLNKTTGIPAITVNDLGILQSGFAPAPKPATISAVVAGADGLTKNGVGKLALTGANTFSGGLTVTDGTVSLGGTQGFSGGINVSGVTSRLEFNSDANLGNTTDYVSPFDPSVILNTLSLSGGATLARTGDAGNVGKDTTLDIGTGGATLSYGGFSFLNFYFNLTGDGALTLNSGSKGVSLRGDNSLHTGGFNINSGDLNFMTSLSLPVEEVGTIVVNANGALGGGGAYFTVTEWLETELVATASTGQIQLFNRGGTGTGTLNEEDVDMTGYDSLFLGASTTENLGTGNILRFKGTITPAGSTYRLSGSRGATLAMDEANILTGANNLIIGNGSFGGSAVNLYASNDFTGTTTVASNNTLNVFSNSALSTGAINMLGTSSLRLTGGLTYGNALTLNGGPTDSAFGALHGSTGANVYDGNITVAAGSRINASNTSGNGLTIDGDIALGSNGLSFTTGANATFAGGDITVAGAISGSGTITKNNATGTLTLSNANPGWTGNTSVAGGALAIGNDSALGTTGTLTLTSSATVRSSDATDRTIPRTFGTFAGTSAVYTFGATSGGTGNLAFTSTTTSSIGSSAARTFQVHNTTKFSMGFSGTGSSINKTGNGTMIMNGTSTYTGGTTVTAGTLGGNGTIGATSVLAGGTIAPGDSGIGTFNTGAVTVAGTLAVEFNGATSDKLLSTGAVDLTGATLTVTSLGSYAGPYIIAQGTSVIGTMTVPPGYAVDISSGTQAILTQTGAPANYAGWASANGVTGGVNGDSDNDGIANGVEYGLNLNFAGSDGSPGTYLGNLLSFDKRDATSGNADLTYMIEVSTDLGISDPWAQVGSYVTNDSDVISANIPTGPAKNFARLRVIVTP